MLYFPSGPLIIWFLLNRACHFDLIIINGINVVDFSDIPFLFLYISSKGFVPMDYKIIPLLLYSATGGNTSVTISVSNTWPVCSVIFRRAITYFLGVLKVSMDRLIMMTLSNGNIFRVTGPLCGEFTGHWWIPRTKASDAEFWYFLWSAPE